jgi:hypothetical protein
MATFEQFRSTFPEDSNEKGEAFEVFLAEWMFKNHPSLSSQSKKVWGFLIGLRLGLQQTF